MSHVFRMFRTPCGVVIWNFWEKAGDSVTFRAFDHIPTAFALTSGAFCATIDPTKKLSPGFEKMQVDDTVTVEAPMMVYADLGKFLKVEALEDGTAGLCMIELDLEVLEKLVGPMRAQAILAADPFDGPFFEAQVNQGSSQHEVTEVTVEMIETVAGLDLKGAAGSGPEVSWLKRFHG